MRPKGYKCSNVKCDSCVGHSMCGELGDAAMNCVDRITTRQTNADRIRAMSDEELAKFLQEPFCDKRTHDECTISYCGVCDQCVLDWLQQPAEAEE